MLKFGIIGTGMIAHFHAKAIHAIDKNALVGAADSRAERAVSFANEYGVHGFESVDALVNDSDIDIVTIATPSGAHLEPALKAIRGGKHVLIEKPLEISVERVDQLLTEAKQAGVVVAAILNRRFTSAMDALKQAVDEGRFGKLTSASAYIKWYRTQEYYDSAAWRGTWALDGGGALMNQSIHTVDALLYSVGPVKSVQAMTDCVAHQDIEVEDIAVVLLEFENGAKGVIEASTATWSQQGHPARVQVAGTEGSAFLADEYFEVWEFMNETPEDIQVRNELMNQHEVALGGNDPNAIDFRQHQRNFEEVIEAIEAGRPPSTCGLEARRSVELIQAVYESAKGGGAKIHI